METGKKKSEGFQRNLKNREKKIWKTVFLQSGLRWYWCSLLCLSCQLRESKYCSERWSPYPLNSYWSDVSCWFFSFIAPYCISRWNSQASSDLSMVSPTRPSWSAAWDLPWGWIPQQHTRWPEFLCFVWAWGNSAPWLHRRTSVPYRSGFLVYSG